MIHDAIDAESAAWAGKTYVEILTIARSPGSIAVVPVGSLEQHGYHLPTATDTILADAVAHGAAAHSSEIPLVITPPVWAGHSDHHLSFGGTLTQSTTALTQHLAKLGELIFDNGFDAVLFVNGHGGNSSVISNAVRELGPQYPKQEVLALTYYKLAASFIDEIRESETGGVNHGGEFETSLMLHIKPELVRIDDMEGTVRDESYDRAPQDLFEPGELSVYRPIAEFTDSGAIGSPELASEEKGAELYDRLCEELAAQYQAIHDTNR